MKVTDTKGTADASDDATTDTLVDLLTIGAADVNAFAGMNGGTDDALGLQLTGTEFALVLASEQKVEAGAIKSQWTSLKAYAEEVSFVGIDDLTISGTGIEVKVNEASADGKLLDFSEAGLEVLTGPGKSITMDLEASQGELMRASGALNINIFNFFSVEGQFGFEKKTQEVTLTTGEKINVDYMGIGASEVSAFAGVNGGSADEIGLSLGDVEFALALMTDKADRTRKFTTLQATAGSVSFVGIDGLVIEADQLSVAINKGYEATAQAERTVKENTKLHLSLDAKMKGVLTFEYEDAESELNIAGNESDAALGTKIKTAIEGLEGIGEGNVKVTGSKIAGYDIEFIGALEGKDLSGLTVS
ncbi:MAG: hypothetical protein FJ045_05625, partial [Crenarchaeota archaeon]|nr:hypothetical protein [Thermoproteota archaeon]